MFKMTSMLTSLATVASVMVSLQMVGKVGSSNPTKIAEQLLQGNGGAIAGLNGSEDKLMDLIKGESPLTAAATEAEAEKPSRPATLIYRTGKNGPDEVRVEQLAPGAGAMVIDGRMQVYYPSKARKTPRRLP